MLARWLLVFLAPAAPLLNAGVVNVELFEKVPAGHEFELTTQQPTERYTEDAFGFVRVPTKYCGRDADWRREAFAAAF